MKNAKRRGIGDVREIICHALIILPAVLFGVVAMICGGVSPMLWGQQTAAFVVFALLGMLRRFAQRLSGAVWSCALVLALCAALFFPAVGGARRWLDLGLLNVNAALLVLPALLILLDGMKRPYPVLLAAAAVLCLQPDLSQLTALALGALPILWRRRQDACWLAVSVCFLAAMAIRCFGVPVALEPADYCEGILAMLGVFSPLMQAAGWLALALVPGSFAYRYFRARDAAPLCLAVYYAVSLAFALTGEYPVLFMGFGMSPIAGYWLAYLLMGKAEAYARR